MDSFIKSRIKNKRQQPPLLEEITESPFEPARAKFDYDKSIKANNFGHMDSKPPINNKYSNTPTPLVKIKERDHLQQYHYFSTFDNKNRSPEYFTKKLSNPIHKTVSIKTLIRLELHLKTASIRWILNFVEIRGVQLLVNSLKYCKNTDNHHKDSIKMTGKSSDSSTVMLSTELEYKILNCFKALANNYIGIREFFANPRYIEEIAYSICSPSIPCRKLVCEILTFVCYYKAPQGQALVLDAMKKLTKKNVYIKSDSIKGVNQFEVWIKSWKQAIRSKSLSAIEECEYSLFNLMLANAIINVIDNLRTRNDLRKRMESCGLETVIDTTVRNEEIYKQIEEFYTQAKQDQPPKKRESITTNDNISVSPTTSGRRRVFKNFIDPHHIFDMLLDNIEGSGCYDYFLNSIQNMLMYISMNEDHNDIIDYFKNIDSYIVARSDNNGVLTYKESTKVIEEQKEKLALLNKDLDLYKSLYKNSVNNYDNTIGIEELNDQKEKNKSLEDLLRMSRHTISTLQQKLKDIQEEYEENIVTLEQQLDQFYKVIEAVHNESENSNKSEGNITINKKEFVKIKARHSLVDGSSINKNDKLLLHDLDNNALLPGDNPTSSTKAQRRTTAMSITEEFKSQLAMQFSTTNISDLVSSANDRHRFSNIHSRRRHSIMVNNSMTTLGNKKFEKNYNRLTLAPGPISYKEEQMLAEPFPGFNFTLNSTMAHVPLSQGQELQHSNNNNNQKNGRRSRSPSLSNSNNVVVVGTTPSTSLESLLSNNNNSNTNFGMESTSSLSTSDELVPAVSLSGSSISSGGSTWSSQKTYYSTTTDESVASLRSMEDSSILSNSNSLIPERINTMECIITKNNTIDKIYEHPHAPPPPSPPLSQSHSNLTPSLSSTWLSVPVNDNSVLSDNMFLESVPVPPPPPPPPPPSSGSYLKNNRSNNNPALSLDVESIQVSNRKEIKRYPSVKTRILQWQKLHKDSIQSTIWCETNRKSMLIDIRKSQSHQNLESTMDKAGLFKKMEETFGHTTKIAGSSNKKQGTMWNKKNLLNNKREHETRILEAQKSANISISVLSKLKHSTIAEIKNNILNLDSAIFDEVLLESLLNNLPTNQEINKLNDASAASLQQQQQQEEVEKEEKLVLSKPDEFCLEIISIPRYRERIGYMLLKINFQDRISHIGKSMTGIMEASTALQNSVAVKEFLNLVLLIGNFLNGSNFQGGAFGIRIASINKLIDTKSSSNDTTLLHFIIDMMETQFPDIFNSLIPDMKLCVDACRVILQDLIKDYSELKADLDKLTATLQSTSDNDEIFHTKMSHFQSEAMIKFDQLEVRYTSMDVAYKDVLLYFGEDPCDMKPDEFFGIFVKFISDWEFARKDLITHKEKIERMNRMHQFEEERRLLKTNREH